MKGVIASISPAIPVIDITHSVTPQAIDEAGFMLASVDRFFPEGTIFVAVVDPGVGGPREIVLLEAARRLFLAPDNGLLSPIIGREQAGLGARYVRERRHFLPEVSATFHGRDIFAPLAARLAARAIRPEDVGPEVAPERLFRLPASGGKIVHVDRFGNLVSDVVPPEGAVPRRARVAGREVGRGARTYAEAAPGEPFAYVGSFGTVEIAMPMGSAAAALGVGRGFPVQVWFDREEGGKEVR